MAVEFTKDGKISLENRSSYFDKGAPTNSDEWISFKKQIDDLYYNDVMAISSQQVNDVFNSIKDTLSGMTLRTPHDQFEQFCKSNNVRIRNDFNGMTYHVKKEAQ
jgi:hypothetical protein